MFRWYQNVAWCYVFLADVSIHNFDPVKLPQCKKQELVITETSCSNHPEQFWEPALCNSRWFQCGWTLQELLALASVEFFSKEGYRLEDKASLKQHIHEITGIPISALQGAVLSEFHVEERFGWAERRQTTRKEDWAYCLLSIFDIFISLIYGEGKAHAVVRLRKEIEKCGEGTVKSFPSLHWLTATMPKDKKCLRHLYVTNPDDNKRRIKGSKGGLLHDLYHWILNNPNYLSWVDDLNHQILWIKGKLGKDKTMLVYRIIDELRQRSPSSLISFFLCQATDSRINNSIVILWGLIFMLINRQPSLITHVQKRYDIVGKSLFETSNAWVILSDIFINILQDLVLKGAYLIIDTIDEYMINLP